MNDTRENRLTAIKVVLMIVALVLGVAVGILINNAVERTFKEEYAYIALATLAGLITGFYSHRNLSQISTAGEYTAVTL